MSLQLFIGGFEISGCQGIFELFRLRNGYGLGEPFINRAVHQPVGKPEHGDDGQERQQQIYDDEPCAELRSRYALAALSIELQQVAPQHQRQGDKGKEDHPRQRGEKEKLLVAVGADELQIERGLCDQEREQQKRADREPDHGFPPARGLGFGVASWMRFGQGSCAPAEPSDGVRDGLIIERGLRYRRFNSTWRSASYVGLEW